MSRVYAMSRVYGEPVNVQARPDGRPARFVWHGRLYTVRVILEHWVVNREWWQNPAAPEPGRPEPAQPEPGQLEPGQLEPGQPELEFWRVEASPGQGLAAETCELRRDTVTGTWMLRPH